MFEDCSLLIDHKKFVDIEKDIICPICLEILSDPFLCNKCQNNFCNNCITKWKINNSKCPICCTNADYIYNRLLNNIIPVLLRYINDKDNTKNEVEDFKNANILQNKQLKEIKIIKEMQNKINKLQEINTNLRNKNDELINKVAILEYEIKELRNNNNDNYYSELNYYSQNERENEESNNDYQNERENEESNNDSQNESENEESNNDSQNEIDEFDEDSQNESDEFDEDFLPNRPKYYTWQLQNQNDNNELNNNENRERLKQAIKDIRKGILKNKNKK